MWPSYNVYVIYDNKKLWQKDILFKNKANSDDLKKSFYKIGSFLQGIRVFRIVYIRIHFLPSILI